MGTIRILSEHLKNIIAAGEVIERPSNVIKELMENSLDASSSFVEVEIEGGGKTYMMVQDDGEGMSQDELPLAIQRHATSKIFSITHLKEISSFGFRGEALPSIGAVSHLKICSVKGDMDVGYCIEVCFGKTSETYPCSLREGTRVEVRDLFIRTPARLKFLRSKGAEAKRCEETFMKIALAHTDKGFSFKRDGKEIYFLEGGEDLYQRLSHLWPPTFVKEMIEIEDSYGPISLKGMVAPPSLSQRRGNRILFYVNNRPIQDRLLMKALRSAYEGMLLTREYPAAVIFLNIPPTDIDVNVHPSKEEIRFRDESFIFSFVQKTVKKAITSSTFASSPPPTHKSYVIQEDSPFYHEENPFPGKQIPPPSLPGTEKSFSAHPPLPFSYLGQVLNSYLLLSLEEGGLMIVDQHAAHERVLYESLRKSSLSSQPLSFPIEKKLPPGIEKGIFDLLKKAGFGFKRRGYRIIIHSYPIILSSGEVKEFLEELLCRQLEGIEEIYKLIACKRAIKAGTRLGYHEAMALLEEWFKTENREFCPHGRPTMIHLDPTTLEKMFKRR